MSVVPITIQAIAYPRDKSHDPFPVTIVGFGWITGLQVGGGPMPGGQPPHVDNTLPPVDEPPPSDPFPALSLDVKQPPPDGGWGYKADSGWYWDPGQSGAGPKRR